MKVQERGQKWLDADLVSPAGAPRRFVKPSAPSGEERCRPPLEARPRTGRIFLALPSSPLQVRRTALPEPGAIDGFSLQCTPHVPPPPPPHHGRPHVPPYIRPLPPAPHHVVLLIIIFILPVLRIAASLTGQSRSGLKVT